MHQPSSIDTRDLLDTTQPSQEDNNEPLMNMTTIAPLRPTTAAGHTTMTMSPSTSSTASLQPPPTSPSTQSVQSLTLSPEEEKRTRSSIFSTPSQPQTPQRNSMSNPRVNDMTSSTMIGQHLTSSTAFYDIPMNDAFSELVDRFIPPDQRPHLDNYAVGLDDKGPEVLANLVMNNQWRTVARYARLQLVNKTQPSDLEQILQLWYLRLLALTKLGLYQLASAEFDKLGDLDRPEFTHEFYGTAEKKGSIVPFELYVLAARLPAWLKHPLVSLERLTMLAVRCKKKQWRQREIQVYLVLATHFLDMGDYASAAGTLEMIRQQFDLADDLDVLSALGRLYLQLGDIKAADKLYTQIEKRDPPEKRSAAIAETIKINRSFLLIAKGDWVKATETLQGVLAANKDNLLAMNNLAVCQVYLGQLGSAMELLTLMTTENPTSAGTCAAALTNLCTLFELRFDAANDKKIDLMKQIARWVGDSFQADCLKLQ